MDEQFINKVINKYKSFRQTFEEQIKSNQIKLQNNECYLIKDYWEKEINRIITNYESSKKSKYTKYSSTNFALPKQNPEFINDISSFVECINKWNKFKLISKEFFSLVNEKLNLNLSQNSIIKYYAGNNKLIIEFKGKNENNAILINGPLSIYYKVYFIEIKKNDWQNRILYNKILSINELNEKIKKEEFDNVIFTKEEFINNRNNNSNNNKNDINNDNKNIYERNKAYQKRYNRTYYNSNNNDNNTKEDNNSNKVNSKTIKSNTRYIRNQLPQDKNTKKWTVNIDSKNEKNEVKNTTQHFWRKRDNNIKEDNTKKNEEYKVQYGDRNFQRNQSYRRFENKNETPKYEIYKLRGENNGINIKDNQIEDFKKQIEDLKNQVKEKDSRICILEKENNLLKQNKEVIKIKDDEIKKIKIINEKNENEISNLKQKNKEIEKKLNEEIKFKENLEKDINKLNKNEKDNLNTILKYEKQILEYEKDKKNWKEIERKLNDKIKLNEENEREHLNQYEKEKKNSKKEIEELKNKISSFEKQINELKQANKNYEKELNDKTNLLNEEIKNNKKKENEYSAKIKENEKNINNLEKELNKEKDLKDNLESELENEKLKIQELEKELDKEKNNNKKLKNDFETENLNNIKEYKRKIENLENENEELKQRNEDTQRKLDNEFKNYQKLSEEKEIEVQNFENKIKDYENKINMYEKKLQKLNYLINPISLYDSPTLIGLNNIGATCFMNATLQCLSQTRDLTNYFLKEKNKELIRKNKIKNRNSDQLCPVYLDLIEKLWDPEGPKSFSPNEFRVLVEKMNSLFKQGQAGDSKDFIIFILEQIHKELKRPTSQKKIKKSCKLNQYDRTNAFNFFFDEFQNETSVISDVFFGFTETTNICLYCKNQYNSINQMEPICYNYGIFNCLIFPLEEIKNMKINNLLQYNTCYFIDNMNNINNNQNNCVNLYDCFIYNQKTDCFTGENRNYCNLCKQLYDSLYTSKIYSSPKFLVLILNRGKNNIFDVKLNFSEELDITQFVILKDQPTLLYSLYGVITHIGQSGPNAHFVASCKSPIDNKWYRYNDAFVSPISNIQKEIIEFGNPYILFYQKN